MSGTGEALTRLVSNAAGLCRENRERNAPLVYGGLDEPSAEDPLAIVQHDRLAGRDRGYRLVERNLDLVTVVSDQLPSRERSPVPDPHRHGISCAWHLREPVHLSRDYTAPEELVTRADHDCAIGGPDVDDVHRNAEATGNASPLPDCVAGKSLVFANDDAIGRHDRPTHKCRSIGRKSLAKDLHVVAVGDEADFLTFRLISHD